MTSFAALLNEQTCPCGRTLPMAYGDGRKHDDGLARVVKQRSLRHLASRVDGGASSELFFTACPWLICQASDPSGGAS